MHQLNVSITTPVKKDTVNLATKQSAQTSDSLTNKKAKIKPNPGPLLKLYYFIVSPKKGTISGIGVIIYYSQSDELMIELPICMLLTLISLFFIYRKKSKHLMLSIFSAISFLLLIEILIRAGVSLSVFLIGFWLLLVLYLAATILNWISYRKGKGENVEAISI